jgi:hypothetical protein
LLERTVLSVDHPDDAAEPAGMMDSIAASTAMGSVLEGVIGVAPGPSIAGDTWGRAPGRKIYSLQIARGSGRNGGRRILAEPGLDPASPART